MNFQRVFSVFLSFATVFMLTPSVLAITQNHVGTQQSVEEILAQYYFVNDYPISTYGVNNTNNTIASKQERTLNALVNSGYEAYSVTMDTFDETEDVLNTDLDAIGLSKEYSYIVVIQGEEQQTGASNRSSISNTFNYSYNGKVYQMRYVTVTAADDPAYGKASSVNVLKSSTRTVIENCLDTAISSYISSIYSPLGTVASLCGLSISDFNTAQESTLNFNGGTNWTRIYTQVWDEQMNDWTFGSSVEYAMASSYMSGLYYSASKNRYVAVPSQAKTVSYYSDHFSDSTWRKQKAVYGAVNYWLQCDSVNDVHYEYGGRTIITHHEYF